MGGVQFVIIAIGCFAEYSTWIHVVAAFSSFAFYFLGYYHFLFLYGWVTASRCCSKACFHGWGVLFSFWGLGRLCGWLIGSIGI